jgi:hypothetical protein
LNKSRFVSKAPIAAAVVLFAALWYFTVPAEPGFRLCGFYWLTGRLCPLCGMTRALFALAKGHVVEALRFNALSPLGFVLLFSLFWSFRGRDRLWTVGVAAVAVYGIFRYSDLHVLRGL